MIVMNIIESYFTEFESKEKKSRVEYIHSKANNIIVSTGS
jgi:hypothetical protein